MANKSLICLTSSRSFVLEDGYTFADLKKARPNYKAFLEKKAKRWAIVVDLLEKHGNGNCSYFVDILEWCKRWSGATSYWYILHDKDRKEDGSKAQAHYHIVLEFPKAVRPTLIFQSFYWFFGAEIIYNEKQKDGSEILTLNPWLSVEEVGNLWGALRYLVHEDEPDKFAYSMSKVVTNEQARFETAIALTGGLTPDNLLYLYVEKCNFDRVQMMKALGLALYKEYRPILEDLDNSLLGQRGKYQKPAYSAQNNAQPN